MTTSVVHHGSPVEWLVARPSVQIAANATLAEASELMEQANVSALLVGFGRRAIVTERDLSQAMGAGYSADAPVCDVATPNPLVVAGTTPVVDVAALMLNEDLRHLVVELPAGDQRIVSMRVVTAVLLSSADQRAARQALSERLDSRRSLAGRRRDAPMSTTGLLTHAAPISRALKSEECWALLRDGTVGRVGVVVDGRPHILPVNYGLADDDVVFRTVAGTLLDAAAGTPIVFEVDGIEPSSRSGWSVCVHGHSVTLDHAHAVRVAPFDSWAPRHRDRWYRIVPEETTGRWLYGPPHHEEPTERL